MFFASLYLLNDQYLEGRLLINDGNNNLVKDNNYYYKVSSNSGIGIRLSLSFFLSRNLSFNFNYQYTQTDFGIVTENFNIFSFGIGFNS